MASQIKRLGFPHVNVVSAIWLDAKREIFEI